MMMNIVKNVPKPVEDVQTNAVRWQLDCTISLRMIYRSNFKQVMIFKRAINHFLEFHKGVVNIILHVIGFAGIFYSIYKLDWVLFTISFIIVEAGHIYNHIAGIQKYESNLRVNLWRLIIFLSFITAFYFISKSV